MIEQDSVHFALTGSSARKLKRGGANLLAGRAFVYHLFPLTAVELGDRFALSDALTFGTLPKILSLSSDAEKRKYLESYAMTYVKEEIVAEQVVRKLTPFRSFLQVSAQMSGKYVNYSAIGRDVGADTKTVISYFDILEETHMGFRLEPFHTSVRKAQKMAPKFYWFDSGVRRALENTLDFVPAPGTSYYGDLFEEFVVNEINRLNSYCETGYRLSYLSTHNSGTEIDVVLTKGGGREVIAIEIKSSSSAPEEKEVYRLKNAAGALGAKRIFYISLHPDPYLIAGVRCLFWQDALREIFLANQQNF
jgi:predicted AAA+ superfamily ATPase